MCGGIYRRCANDGGAREERRGAERGRKKANEKDGQRECMGERERERESRRPRATRGVERLVTQVQSSAPACPRAV